MMQWGQTAWYHCKYIVITTFRGCEVKLITTIIIHPFFEASQHIFRLSKIKVNRILYDSVTSCLLIKVYFTFSFLNRYQTWKHDVLHYRSIYLDM